jgi:hypothetical protein
MDEVLARSGIFQGVDPDASEALAREMETIEVRKGEVVFNEGEPARQPLYRPFWKDQARPARRRWPPEPGVP